MSQPRGPSELSPRRRRRLLAAAILRSTGTATVLLVMYFVLPFTRLAATPYLIAFVGEAVLVTAVVVAEFVVTWRSPYPRLRAVEAMLICGPLYLVLSASAHYLVGMSQPGSYTESMTRLDALYFTVATFATVGFGDIAPVSEIARLMTTVQMFAGLILVGVIAKLLLGVARVRVQKRSETRPDEDS